MRTSHSSARARLLPAGLLTVGAVGAALLVAPQAAFAAGTVSPSAGPTGTPVTVTSSTAVTQASPAVEMRSDQTCTGSTYTAPSTSVFAVTGVTKSSDGLSLTFSVPSGLTLATGSAPKSYNICVYASSTTGAALVTDASGATFNLVPSAIPTAATGASGGGNTITVNAPTGAAIFGSGPYGVAFTSSGGCTANMPSSTNNPLTSTATKAGTASTQVTIPVPTGVGGGPTATSFSICIYSGTTTSGTLIAASTPTAYTVTAPSSTPSSTIGAGGNGSTPVNLTLLSNTNNFLNGVTTTPYVVLYASPTACPGTYPSSPTSNTYAAARKLAINKAAFTLPSAITTTSTTSTAYNICLYSSNSTTTGRLVTASTYTVANVPTLVSVSPASGSALGGNTITVTGTNFPQTAGSITATLGGTLLGQITPIDSTSFTAVTPAHSTGKVALTITTAVGSDTLPNAFEYMNSIQVSPNSASNTSPAVNVDVQGTGFLNLSFGTNLSDSHVYLVDGVYNATTGTGNTGKQNGPVAECGSVLVFSDSELACTLNLTVAQNAAGTLTPNGYRSVSDAVTTSSSNILTSASAAFTQADVGKDLTPSDNTKIAANTTILAVLSPTTAVMSKDSVAAGTTITVAIGYQRTGVAVSAASDNTVTGATSAFSQADVGRYITASSGIPANTVITAVNDTGTTATLSNATTATPTTVDVSSGNPVPNGAYNITVVSSGATNAATAVNPTIPWSQTVVSSGSTFTVAPF